MAKKKVVEETAAVAEPTPEEVAIRDAAKDVADAKAALDEATATHAEAVAAHAELTKPALAVAGKHFLMEGSKVPVLLPNPADEAYPRRMTINGVNYEHVSDEVGVDENGKEAVVWVYRSM